MEIPVEEQPTVRKRLLEEFSCLPVFMDDVTADLYYNGFSNRYFFSHVT